MNRVFLHTLVATILLVIPSHSATTNSAGSTGAQFLELGIGARAAGMGEAQTAWSDDIYGSYFNPSGIATVARQELGFVHNTLYLDLDYNYLGYLLPLPTGGVLGVTGLYVDLGSVERREVVAGEPSAILGAAEGQDVSFSVTYAQTMRDFLDLGATLKSVHEDLDGRSSSAFAVDLGAKWRPPIDGLTVGLSLANIGTSLKHVRERDELPITLRAGIGYRAPSRLWGLTGDMVWVKNQDIEGKIGAEIWPWREHLAFRVGANSANDVGRAFTVGAAFRWSDLELDYAYIPYGDLGNQNLFSLGYQFGTQRRIHTSERIILTSREKHELPGAKTAPVVPASAPSSARREESLMGPTVVAADKTGAYAGAFLYQGGPAEFAWLSQGSADVLNHSWTKGAFLAPNRASAIFTVDGDYWVMEGRLILSAVLMRGSERVATFEITGDVNEPFIPWTEMTAKINRTFMDLGYRFTVPVSARPAPVVSALPPEPVRPPPTVPVYTPPPVVPVYTPAPSYMPAPVPPPEPEAPKKLITITRLREYPRLQETARTRRVAAAMEPALWKAGWEMDAEAPYKFEATLSYLDGAVIVYGKVVDSATGIPLGVVEVEGIESNIDGLAERIALAVVGKLPK